MIQLKWSNGTINEKSMKKNITKINNTGISNKSVNNNNIIMGDIELGTINDMNNIGNNIFGNEIINTPDIRENLKGCDLNKEIFTQRTKYREEQNEKISNRLMVIQKNINPFVTNGNYIEHLNTEDAFLRPKDSNYN